MDERRSDRTLNPARRSLVVAALACWMVAAAGCTHTLPNLRSCQTCFAARASRPAEAEPSDCHACFEIRRRDPQRRDADSLQHSYSEEYAYIGSRRRQLQGAATADAPHEDGVPPNLIGLALSGGGIRSASFSLGALQALETADVFSQFDYLSAVSGGGYLAGWLQAHLGARQLFDRDLYYYDVSASSPAALLDDAGDNVEHLRTHSGFLNQGGWFESGELFLDWLKRWPAHLLLDDVLHIRGKYNWQHILGIYQDRIERTYFRGDPPAQRGARPIAETPLNEINDTARAQQAPYLVLNANLANVGASRVGVQSGDASGGSFLTPQPEQWNFEFTRDFVGSDGTGYLDTRGFGLGVEKVLNGPSGPAAAVVDLGSSDGSRFRLSGGVAAAGAAFDSAAVLYELDVPGLTELGQLVAGGVLNLYLGLETPNFARRYDQWWSTPYDYARMVTVERVPRWHTTSARWLYITDGGHYDNLGVLSLLRRGVRCIVAVDATADPRHRYDDLKTLRQRAQQELDLKWIDRLPPDGEDTQAVYRFRVADQHGDVQAIVLYLKASADPGLPHLQELPGISRSPAMRQIEAIRRADVASVDTLFDEVGRASAGMPPGVRAAVDAPHRTAIHERLAEYYQSIVARADAAERQAGDFQSRIDALRKQVADAELQLVTAEGKREETERQLSDLRTALAPLQAQPVPNGETGKPTEPVSPDQPQVIAQATEEQLGTAAEVKARIAALEVEVGTFRAAEERYRKAIDTAWAEIHTLTPQLAAAKITEVPPPDEVTQALDPVFATIRHIGNQDQRLEASEQHFNLARQRNARRLSRALHDYRDWVARDAARATRIRKVLSFANSPKGRGAFPNDSTLKQSYEWERFEAYRLLGFQMASTFIDQFEPGAALDWCDFTR